jgi:hypothetical protein
VITIKCNLQECKIDAFGKIIDCSCDVRNEINGRRHADQVVYTIPGKQPYQPRQFPKGIWKIGRPESRTDKYLAPFFIPTDAWREVTVYDVERIDNIDRYKNPTLRKEIDRAYGLHYSTSQTTLGCIKIEKESDLLWLVEQINNFRTDKIDIFLEVI